MAGPGALLRRGRQDDPPHPGRPRAAKGGDQTWGKRPARDARRGPHDSRAGEGRHAVAGRVPERVGGLRPAQISSSGDALFRRPVREGHRCRAEYNRSHGAPRLEYRSRLAVPPDAGRAKFMTPAAWHEVEVVLSEVLDLPVAERSSRIVQLCGARADLKTEVESLLSAHEKAASFLEGNAEFDLTATPAFSLQGKQLGPYRLLSIVGVGGMGTVYRAERTDGRFQKQVAIKVTPAAIHSPELLRRFTGEQQILATLEHPNIARLLDAGVSAEGIPYFVMEFVEGIPVNEYCDTRQLSTKQRLSLFRTLCSAVQYAHQHLVVHRDLKQANILVTADGVPKLLDLALRKLLSPGPQERRVKHAR